MAELWTTESRKRLATVADVLAVAIAVSLPWSTSATAILVGLWFFALVPVLRWDELRLRTGLFRITGQNTGIKMI